VPPVFVPWTREHPECRGALAHAAPVYVDVSADLFAYWRMLRKCWRAGSAFVLVEHDVMVRPDTIAELADCPEPWCAFAVWMGEGEIATLGCVRFGEAVVRDPFPAPEPVEWTGLDMAMEHGLRGWTKHVHRPALGHLNPGVVELDRRRGAI